VLHRTSMIGYVPQRDDVIDDPNYLKPVADKDPNILPPFKQVANLETALNWPGQNGVQAQLVYVNAIQNVIYDGLELKLPAAAPTTLGRLLRAVKGVCFLQKSSRQLRASPSSSPSWPMSF
jgi:hypothetical protein